MNIDFEKGGGLIPAVVQDSATRRVLMVGYMNREAVEKTQREGRVCFYSRTKRRLWTKGESSGNYLEVRQILPDCDRDTLLIKADPAGPVCHTGSDTCFQEQNGEPDFLAYLSGIIKERKHHGDRRSYTRGLLNAGVKRIAQKVGEESVELAIAAVDEDAEAFLNEAADLVFHLLVLLEARDASIDDVIDVLRSRRR